MLWITVSLYIYTFLEPKFHCLISELQEKITHFHRKWIGWTTPVKALVLAAMFFINLPSVFSGHDLVWLKDKPSLICWHHWVPEGSWKMERFPAWCWLQSRMALALTTRLTALLQIHVTVGWASGLEKASHRVVYPRKIISSCTLWFCFSWFFCSAVGHTDRKMSVVLFVGWVAVLGLFFWPVKRFNYWRLRISVLFYYETRFLSPQSVFWEEKGPSQRGYGLPCQILTACRNSFKWY